MLSWWTVVAPGYGSIMVKGHYRAEALNEAAERLGCDREEITVCTEAEAFYGSQRPVRDFDGRRIRN